MTDALLGPAGPAVAAVNARALVTPRWRFSAATPRSSARRRTKMSQGRKGPAAGQQMPRRHRCQARTLVAARRLGNIYFRSPPPRSSAPIPTRRQNEKRDPFDSTMPDPSGLPAQAPRLDMSRDLLPERRPAPRYDHADQSESRLRCGSDVRSPTGSATASRAGPRPARRIWAGVTWSRAGRCQAAPGDSRQHRAAATWPPHCRVRVRGTPRPRCGPAADLVPQRPSSPAARAHRPGCPATIATPPPLPCRPQLRAAPLVRIRTRLTSASNDAASAA